jgi:hypothetical protein
VSSGSSPPPICRIENDIHKHIVAQVNKPVNDTRNNSQEKKSTEVTRNIHSQTYNAKRLLNLDITCKIGATGSNKNGVTRPSTKQRSSITSFIPQCKIRWIKRT